MKEEAYQYKPHHWAALTLGFTWVPWAAAIALGAGQEEVEAYSFQGVVFAFAIFGLFGPTIASLIMIFRSGSRALKADFKDRLFNLRRIIPRFLVLTIVLPTAVVSTAIGISLLFGQPTDQFSLTADTNELGKLFMMVLLTMILAPIFEEMGWRGYGVDSFRSKLSPLKMSLAFGVFWGLWHAPLFWMPGTYHYGLAQMDSPIYAINFFVSIIGAVIVINWLFYKNNRSILAAAVAHSAGNAAGVLIAATPTTDLISTGVYFAVALVVVLLDRKHFNEGPRTFLTSPGGPDA
jgi:membrane protease YdiL (CAAX protease family)